MRGLLVPREQITQASLQRSATVRMRRTTKVGHNREAVSHDLHVPCLVEGPLSHLAGQHEDALPVNLRHLGGSCFHFNEQLRRSLPQDHFRCVVFLQSGGLGDA